MSVCKKKIKVLCLINFLIYCFLNKIKPSINRHKSWNITCLEQESNCAGQIIGLKSSLLRFYFHNSGQECWHPVTDPRCRFSCLHNGPLCRRELLRSKPRPRMSECTRGQKGPDILGRPSQSRSTRRPLYATSSVELLTNLSPAALLAQSSIYFSLFFPAWSAAHQMSF